MTKALRSIALSKEWAELRSIDLTQRLESGDLLTQEETVDFVNFARTTSVSQSEESQPPAVVAPDTHYTRVLDARAYLGWRAEIAIHRISIASGGYGDAAQKLADWKRMIGGLVRGGFSEKKYALPSELRKRFCSRDSARAFRKLCCHSTGRLRVASVMTKPGAMVTRTPCGPISLASPLVIARTAPLVAT